MPAIRMDVLKKGRTVWGSWRQQRGSPRWRDQWFRVPGRVFGLPEPWEWDCPPPAGRRLRPSCRRRRRQAIRGPFECLTGAAAAPRDFARHSSKHSRKIKVNEIYISLTRPERSSPSAIQKAEDEHLGNTVKRTRKRLFSCIFIKID